MVARRTNQAKRPSLGRPEHKRHCLDARPDGQFGGKIGAGRNPGVRVEHSTARRFDFADPAEVIDWMNPLELFDRSPRAHGSLGRSRDSRCVRGDAGSPADAPAARGAGQEPDGRASGGSVKSPTRIVSPAMSFVRADERSPECRPRMIAKRDRDRHRLAGRRFAFEGFHVKRWEAPRGNHRVPAICSPAGLQLESVAMKPTPPRLGSCRTREILVVIAFTVIGGVLAPLVHRPPRACAL